MKRRTITINDEVYMKLLEYQLHLYKIKNDKPTMSEALDVLLKIEQEQRLKVCENSENEKKPE